MSSTNENLAKIQFKPRTVSVIYKFVFIVTVARLIWNFLYGFRWPSDYVMASSVFTYDFGFIPRGFVASVLKLVFGYHIYSLKFLYILILGTCLITLLCFIYLSYYFTIKTQNPIGSLLILWYSLSIYSAYISHEMGYFEQYGFVLICAVTVLPIHFKRNSSYTIFYAFLMFISLLISETNAFLICPIFLALTAYRIYENIEQALRDGSLFTGVFNKKGFIKDIALAIGANIPSLIYSIWSGIYIVPEEQIQNIKDLVRSHTRLLDARLDGVGSYYSTGRTHMNTYVSDVNFIVWNWQLLCYILLIIFVVSAVLVFAGYWQRAAFYIIASALMMICAYLVNFVGWDQERFKFNAAMMITFFSIWMIKELGANKLVLNKDIFYLCSLTTIVMLSIMDFRLGLFDGAVYNASLTQFKETLRSTWRLNY